MDMHICSIVIQAVERKVVSKEFSACMLLYEQWKGVFADRYRLQNNWMKGRCNVRTFEGHTQGG